MSENMVRTSGGLIVPARSIEFKFPDEKDLPAGWTKHNSRIPDQHVYVRRHGRLGVIGSIGVHDDDKTYVHVSASMVNALPNWKDIKEVKELFIGVDRYAYMIFPPKEFYVNLHKYALHLWSCLDGPVMPEFSQMFGKARSI